MSSRAAPSLRVQLTAALVALAVVPALILGAYGLRSSVRIVEENLARRSRRIAGAVAAEVERFLEAHVIDVREIQLELEAGASPTARDLTRHLDLHLAANRSLRTLLVLDRDLRVRAVAPADPDLLGVDLSRQPAVAAARGRGEATWSAASIDFESGQPVTTLVLPGDGWTVVGHLDLGALTAIPARSQVAREVTVSIVDQLGTFIAHRDAGLVRERVSVRDVPFVLRALRGEGGVEQADLLGRRVLVSGARVEGAGWLVLVEEPADRAYAGLRRMQGAMIGVTVAAVLFALAAGLLLARRVLRPIAALREAAGRVAAGDYALAIPHGQFAETDALASSFETMVTAVRDRERLEEQLRHSQRLEAVGRLAGGVAHDFNNLLTAITGFASVLRDEARGDPADREALDGILHAADRGAHLTRSLLAYGRRQVLDPRPTDLRGCVQSVVQLVRRLVREDVRIETALPDAPLVAMVDPGQVEQVLMNLCTNARDAMPRGGRIRIEADSADLDDDAARAEGLARGGRLARLRVSDTGEGMSREVRERIFEPFFTTKEPGKGTGLGLAIAYGIVQQHGGEITVTSAPGGGTTFSVHLPRLEETATAAAEDRPAAAPRAAGSCSTVLVAEDEPLVRRAMVRLLAQGGFDVVEAEDGEEAVRVFTEEPDRFCLCLFDLAMPRLGGLAARRAVLAIRPGVPVLLASGYAAGSADEGEPLEDGVEFIQKPPVPSELLAKVRSLIAARAAR